MAETTRPHETEEQAAARGRLEAETKVRRELNAQAEQVMANSQPTPTQEECDQIKTGTLPPVGVAPPETPEMPPLDEQQRRVAEAGSGAPYQTRDATANRRVTAPAPPPAPRPAPHPPSDDKR